MGIFERGHLETGALGSCVSERAPAISANRALRGTLECPKRGVGERLGRQHVEQARPLKARPSNGVFWSTTAGSSWDFPAIP